LRTRDTW